jgi:hypothetical protein
MIQIDGRPEPASFFCFCVPRRVVKARDGLWLHHQKHVTTPHDYEQFQLAPEKATLDGAQDKIWILFPQLRQRCAQDLRDSRQACRVALGFSLTDFQLSDLSEAANSLQLVAWYFPSLGSQTPSPAVRCPRRGFTGQSTTSACMSVRRSSHHNPVTNHTPQWVRSFLQTRIEVRGRRDLKPLTSMPLTIMA